MRHQCFVLKVHISILSAIDTFPGDEVLQETAIEALIVLGGAGELFLQVVRCQKSYQSCHLLYLRFNFSKVNGSKSQAVHIEVIQLKTQIK